MTWIYNNDLTKPIADNASFNTPDVKYPGNWDKSTVAGMIKVAETPRPDDALNAVTGSHVELVNGAPTRVWDSTPRTAQDLKDRANTPIIVKIEAKEKQMFRSVTELVRARENGDVSADVATAAKARFTTLYDEREALRAQLQK